MKPTRHYRQPQGHKAVLPQTACCRPNHFRIATWYKAPWKGTGFRYPWNLCLWNPESWALESGIQPKESRIPLTIETQNPSFSDKDWNPPKSKAVLDSLKWGDTKWKWSDYKKRKQKKNCQSIQLTRHITNSNVLVIQTQKGQIYNWNVTTTKK